MFLVREREGVGMKIVRKIVLPGMYLVVGLLSISGEKLNGLRLVQVLE